MSDRVKFEGVEGTPGQSDASQRLVSEFGPRAGRAQVLWIALASVCALVACILLYLALAVPSRWFPSLSPVVFAARDLSLSRGTAKLIGNELIVTETDATGIAVVSVGSDLRSSEYPAIAWMGIDFPEDAQVTLLWQSDYAPGTLNAAPIKIESGRPQPTVLVGHPRWIGRIKGLALAVRGSLTRPLIVQGVVAKTMGASEILADRAREWFAFEGWTGTSINSVTGGADVQGLPLPLLLATSIALASGVLALVRRVRPQAVPVDQLIVIAGVFLVFWGMLDARWTMNLMRQFAVTQALFGGKSWEAKRLANDDGPLFAFMQKALATLPSSPVRIFVVADAHYFRGRAAYHLYPHSVWFDPRANAVPPANAMKRGDWMLVYQRRGIAYDAAQRRLRWDESQIVSAELKLAGQGAALFEIK